MPETTYWGIHANFAKAEELFLAKGRIALGWPAAGDLSVIGHDKEALKAQLKKTHPTSKPGAIPVYAGELYRFVNDMAEGDVIVYRSKSEPVIHLGRVKGPYFYDPKTDGEYPNCRPVEWFRNVPITDVSQGALYELGAFLSLFLVKTYSDEWAQLASGAQPVPLAEVDDTVAEVSAATELNTRDFIRKPARQGAEGPPVLALRGGPPAYDGLPDAGGAGGRRRWGRHHRPPRRARF